MNLTISPYNKYCRRLLGNRSFRLCRYFRIFTPKYTKGSYKPFYREQGMSRSNVVGGKGSELQPNESSMAITKNQVREALKNVIDPNEGADLISQDMVHDIIVQEKYVTFTVELRTNAHSAKEQIKSACENAIKKYVDKDAILDIQIETDVSKKRQNPNIQTQQLSSGQQGDQELLPGVKNIIAVASGKGGVGKSTVAVNLACALARSGASVGLLDTDIYGPSIPTMFDVHEKPNITTRKKLIPIEKYGVKLLSMGMLVDPDQAMIWRGPMVTSAVKQFMTDAEWGELDYMVLDLPPGTGDIQLTIVQTVPLTGAVIVSTPQNVALDDARKGVAMFKKVNVPVLGIIENMAYFTPPELPGKKYYIFGQGGAKKLSDKLGANFLGEIPIQQDIRESCDEGKPIVLEDVTSPSAQAFIEVGSRVAQQVAQRNEEQDPTEKIDIKIKP